eukprot:TRINITY_DN9703_c0_g1_i1.p1 TRINITY_DN9703_c0_g1~~TRINITY_DN9703_c0_g1_i1.p1  ORF type:complete len:361 (+),score=98.62 TRINITY_DN9703_c0_g1_i1:161-1243(+)
MADALFNEGNSLFVDENYEEALDKYTKAIEAQPKVEFFLKRSACHAKLKNFTDALDDANAAIRLDPQNPQGYMKKGMACFSLDEYETAKASFEKGLSLEPSNSQWKTWIRKCNVELEIDNQDDIASPSTTPQTAHATVTPTPELSQGSAAEKPAPPAAAKPTLRHEWFQTATAVVVSVFCKGLKKEDVEVEFHEDSLSLSIKLPTSSEYQHSWDLFSTIVPSESSYQIFSTKIEIKLKKKEAIQWVTLERILAAGPVVKMADVLPVIEQPPSYPTSSKSKKNWDAIAKIADEDKPEGEEALNKVFQDIYANGNEDQRRAMIKSFVESGGTVLSTNWTEVGTKKVEGSPPKGMEMHSWNEN